MSEREYQGFLDRVVEASEAALMGILGGRDAVVFLAPMGAHNAIAVEAWQAVAQWDVQTAEDGTVNAVRYGAPEGDPEHTQTLANLKSRITTDAASDDFAGKLIANISGLNQYYRDIGAYDLGLHRLTAQQSDDFHQLVIGKHRASSFVITSNRAIEEWLGLFNDPILGNSALDRLANGSFQIVIEGSQLPREALPSPRPTRRGGHKSDQGR